jgi:hypothetical protein
MQYVLYEMPAFFVVALLGMNGTGVSVEIFILRRPKLILSQVLVATEWVAVEYIHRPNFDSPALRAGEKSATHS